MHIQSHAWEHRLLSLAYADSSIKTSAAHNPIANSSQLEEAYAYCETLTAEHSRSFYLASRLLPADKRRAARALYAFCRISDDIVDRTTDNVEAKFQCWRNLTSQARPSSENLVALAWADTRHRFRIPQHYAEQLLDGVARDMHEARYETFADLTTYAYGVASTVGLMSMHIIGFDGPQALPYAIKLGVALQMTNILRDVAEDWRAGRLYLPQQELARFGLSEGDLEYGLIDDRWRAFMAFQIARNRQLYAEALPGISFLKQDGRFSITAAALLYQAILDDIEARDYDVFNRRAFVSGWGKVRMLPSIWWRSKQ